MNDKLEELPIELSAGELVTRYVEWGEMAVRYMRIPAGTDMDPVLQGLPDDRCPSPHWGLVLEGSIHLVHADGTEETTRAGQAYYWPAGHTAWFEESSVIVEIGPVAEMRQFSEHAKAKLG
ncbi:MAG: hypothetical protein ACODAF_08065 [Actinomycetota bacterium]